MATNTKNEATAASVTTPTDADLPSRDDTKVRTATRTATSDSDDVNVGWTNQKPVPEQEAAFEDTNIVSREQLPTKEGLDDAGVYDVGNYLSNVKREREGGASKSSASSSTTTTATSGYSA